MTHTDCATAALTSARTIHRSLLIRLLIRLVNGHALWQQRRRLVALDDAALCDMGLTRTDIRAELTRPIWNAPDQWLR